MRSSVPLKDPSDLSRKNQKKGISIQDTCMIGVMAAVIAVMAQISIPMPLGVPMTMQTFAVTLAAVLLGSKKGGLAVLVYVLLGAVGLPVFSGFKGGVSSLLGPTGGFLFSFPPMAYAIGLGVEWRGRWKGMYVLFLVLGTVLNYVAGLFYFCLVTQGNLTAGLGACVLPFIPTAVVKAVLASLIGFAIRRRMPTML